MIKRRDEAGAGDSGDFMDRLRTMLKTIRSSPGKTLEGGVTEEMVIAQGIIFLQGGFETTSTTLSLLCHALATNPEAQEMCRTEIIDTVQNIDDIGHEDIKELPYLEACIKETLRLYPILIRNSRLCTSDAVVKGMKIKAGTTVVIPVYAMHRNKDFYGEDADEFRPERFLDDEADGADRLDQQLTYHPFGAGPRICIGMRFAMSEMKVTMAKLLANFRLLEEPGVTSPIKFKPGNIATLSFDEIDVRLQKRREI